jgi:tetratricopeptide (TPR) repeat protein/tRNA A-37 threonylcarbamoyl transferase component Bud32
MNADPSASSAWYSDPGTLLDMLRRVEQATPATPAPEIPGYRDLVEIARGGQGVVYTGVQASTKRRVAIKLLTPRAEHDERARRRFEREVNLAARLRHPNIVRIYDSGSTGDGRLYCVMDFIEGGSLRDHLLGLNEGASPQNATLSETLRLFHTISLALTAAHQRGVIHRDLKPSNIRVDPTGTPHLLDFGLAKAIEGADELSGSVPSVTEHSGQFAGSLPWASPEQVGADSSEIDVRTDIYSLGVMLYQALTGEFPYPVTGSIRETVNAIAETEPAPPGSRRPGLGRDLDTLVLTCLAKDKNRRYQSAAELAEDLRRVIAGEPILARSDTAWQAMNRSLRRYRLAFTLVAIGGGAVAGVALLLAFMYTRATQAEAAAHRETVHATTVNRFLEDMLASPDPGNLGREVTVREMVDRAAEQLESDASLPRTTRASLHGVIAGTRSSLGQFDEALTHAQEAVRLSELERGSGHEQTIEYRNLLASQLIALSRFDEAQGVLEDALGHARSGLGESHPTTLSIWSNLASLLSERGAYEEAIQIHERVYAARMETLGPDDERTIGSLHHLAIEENAAGRYDESLAHYRQAAGLSTATLGDEHPRTLSIRSGLAVAIEQRGDPAASAEMLRELVPIATRVWGPDHRDTNILKTNLAFALDQIGSIDESLVLTREILESTERTLGADHADTINARNGLAGALYRHADFEGAAELLAVSRDIALERFGRLHVRSLDSGANLAQVLRRTGDTTRASSVAEEVLIDAQAYFGAENPELAWYAKVAGDIRLELGDAPGAVERLELARELVARQHDYPLHRSTLKSLASALHAAGRRDEALRVIEACATLMRSEGESEEAIEALQQLAPAP